MPHVDSRGPPRAVSRVRRSGISVAPRPTAGSSAAGSRDSSRARAAGRRGLDGAGGGSRGCWPRKITRWLGEIRSITGSSASSACSIRFSAKPKRSWTSSSIHGCGGASSFFMKIARRVDSQDGVGTCAPRKPAAVRAWETSDVPNSRRYQERSHGRNSWASLKRRHASIDGVGSVAEGCRQVPDDGGFSDLLVRHHGARAGREVSVPFGGV